MARPPHGPLQPEAHKPAEEVEIHTPSPLPPSRAPPAQSQLRGGVFVCRRLLAEGLSSCLVGVEYAVMSVGKVV